MSTDSQTIAVYDTSAEEYDNRFGKLEPETHLLNFISAMPKGAYVLDLGCGPGHASAEMKAAGLVPDSVDASAEMVSIAKNRYGLDARLATFDDITSKETYHGIWANYSLLHAKRADMPRYFKALHHALLPEGLLHLAMKKGTGDGRDRLGRYYTYLAPDELTGMLRDAGFTPGKIEEKEIKGLASTPDIGITMHAYA